MAMFPCSLKPLGGPLYLTYAIDSYSETLIHLLHHRLQFISRLFQPGDCVSNLMGFGGGADYGNCF